jgi:hypothetical protein
LRRNFHNLQRQDASSLKLDDNWNNGWINSTFDIIWQAYDKLLEYYNDKGRVAKTESEDEITFSLLRHTDIVKGFYPAKFRKLKFHNQPPDKSQTRRRKNNTNDIGVFFGNEIEKPAFIFESKKISTLTEKGIDSYKEDLEAFLVEYYGAHLTESALIAYLHKGTPTKMFHLIKNSFKTKLNKFSAFINRPHKTSKHKKISNSSHPDFLCHHLIFEMN